MSSPKKLDSPIQLAHRRRTAVFETPLPSIPVEMAVTQRDSIKHGSPYDQLDRLFVGLHPSWNGIDAIEFKDGSPVGFVSHYSPQGKDIPLQRLTQVTHPSFLAYKEIFISQGDVYFLYEQWGVTLEQVWKLSPVFRLGEAEVAIICKKILQGLLYIHKELNIFYGDLKCSDVIITHGGEVKIGNSPEPNMYTLMLTTKVGIGSKLFQKPGLLGKNRDVQDVCNIARLLLQQGESCGPVRFLAEDFIGVPPTSTAEALLEHPFLQTTAPSWCLKPVPMLYAIAREKQVL